MTKNSKTLKTNDATTEFKPQPAAAPAAVAKPPAAKSQATRADSAARISLQLINPTAKKVCVAGSFNEWKPEATPLTQTGNGQWIGDLAVRPGRHEYLFVVDGQWLPDPKAKESVANPFGGRNSVLIA
jgi:1,4-alpha-glucan branching enzyme